MTDEQIQRQALQASIIELMFVLLSRMGYVPYPNDIGVSSIEQLSAYRFHLLDILYQNDSYEKDPPGEGSSPPGHVPDEIIAGSRRLR